MFTTMPDYVDEIAISVDPGSDLGLTAVLLPEREDAAETDKD